MLNYDEALARILDTVLTPLPSETVPLEQAHCRALASDVIADVDLPPFDNSAVDGFALCETDYQRAQREPITLSLGAEVPAGSYTELPVSEGVAVPLFTGSPIPPGTAAIVMWEDTETREDGTLRLLGSGSPKHTRRAGSDLPRGALALSAGMTLDAGAIGILSSLNRSAVPVVRRPRVGLLATGDELVPVGGPSLRPGQIRNSSTPALTAAVEEAGGRVVLQRIVADSPEATRAALTELARECDVIVSSGGVSVGAHDYVKAAVEAVGRLDFWRIAVKPGKPLAFGHIGDARFFGLPGNPVSSLVTFELFVRPVLRRLAGHQRVQRTIVEVELAAPLPHTSGRREFARARVLPGAAESKKEGGGSLMALPLGLQDSHRLASIAGADALLIAHEEHGDYPVGERLPALLLR